jgi:hypothetical protein
VFIILFIKNHYRIKNLQINLPFKKVYDFSLVGWNDVAGLVVLNVPKECVSLYLGFKESKKNVLVDPHTAE